MKKLTFLFLIYTVLVNQIYPQYKLGKGNNNKSFTYGNIQETLLNQGNLTETILDSILMETMDIRHIPGMQVRIVKKGEIDWNKNYGLADVALNKPVTDSTIFLAPAIPYTIAATAIMQLWEDGLFALDDNINDYLQPDFQVVNPNYPNDSITFKMLLTHTSSIRDNVPIIPPEACGDSPIPLDSIVVNYFTTGGKYYSASNFNTWEPGGGEPEISEMAMSVLAFVVEKLSGLSYSQYCEENIFNPLEMYKTSYFLEGMDTSEIAIPYNYWDGNEYIPYCNWGYSPYIGDFRTNQIELGHYLSAFMNHGTYNGTKILDSSTVDLMLTDYYPIDNGPALQLDEKVGLLWLNSKINGRWLWGHWGGYTGTSCAMYFYLKEDWGLIFLYNIEPGRTSGQRLDVYLGILDIISEYAHFYGNIYSIDTKAGKNYISSTGDSLTLTTNFENIFDHEFTANAVYFNSDSSFVDSISLYDDGLHGDGGASDGVWGGFIPSTGEEELFSVGISTIDNQTGKYFSTGDLTRFTTAGPIKVDSLSITKASSTLYRVKPFLKNEGQSYTVKNLGINVSTNDSSITNIGGSTPKITSIAPGETVGPSNNLFVSVDSTFSGVFNFNFEITINDWTYWRDSTSTIVTGVKDKMIQPLSYRLHQNYPNPFNPSTTFNYSIPKQSKVIIKVYDILGNEIADLVNEEKAAGTYEVKWNAEGLPSGVYFCLLRAGSFVQTNKMILLK